MAMDLALDALFDPLLNDTFSRVRRAATTGPLGRVQVTPTTTQGLYGVVTMYTDIEDIRAEFPEMRYDTRVISVVTKNQLQAAVTGFQPDQVLWRGDTYVVLRISPYPQFGLGWYQAVCMSVDQTDAQI